MATLKRLPLASLGGTPQVFNYGRELISRILSCCREEARSVVGTWGGRRDASEILRLAATSLLSPTAKLSSEDGYSPDLFQQLDLLSTLFYEGSATHGAISFVEGNSEDIDWQLQLVRPIPLSQARWARKFLEISSPDFCAVSDGRSMLGIARPNSSSLAVHFTGHHRWKLTCHGKPLMVASLGVPTLPKRELDLNQVDDVLTRLFATADLDAKEIRRLATLLESSEHGTTLIIASDAPERAAKLAAAANVVVPQRLSNEAFLGAARIDGATLVDPRGICHAIGVILDGEASPNESPARGARFNSALRHSQTGDLLALVRSEDGGIDLLPRLRRQIKRSQLNSLVQQLAMEDEASSLSIARQLIPYLEYLDDEQRKTVADASVPLYFDDRELFGRIYDPHPTDVVEDT